MTLEASIFVIVAALLCTSAALAVFGVTHVWLSGSEGIERDGLYPGEVAPAWTLTDSRGKAHVSPPPGGIMQLIVFADHSLKHFPGVADGVKDLLDDPHTEIIVLLPRQNESCEPVLSVLGLGGVPILAASPRLYASYNVRVTPWVMFVDSRGKVRASSLVNHEWQIDRLRKLADIRLQGPPGHDALAAAEFRKEHGGAR